MTSLRMFGGVFTVRLGPTIITGVMLAVLLALGTWQVERLHWKENLITTIKQRMAEAPVDLSTIGDPTAAEYRTVKASGIFENDKELALTALSRVGAGGYHILTPFRLTDGRFLLVDRGWVPYDKRDASARREGQIAGQASITGILRLPHHRWLQPVNHPERGEWYGIDLLTMAKATNVPGLLPFVLEAGATPNAGGYPVGGQTYVDMPNNHFVYALTWYMLAAALVVIYGMSGWRRDDVAAKDR